MVELVHKVMKDNGEIILETDMVDMFLTIIVFMKENGKMERNLGRANSYIRMEMFMKEIF